MGRKSFLKGAAVLALAGVAVRLIGALYRIPLSNILGAEGVGIYQMAYPVYALLLTLSTAGIPGAISKLVSERLVHGDRQGARRVFHISLALLCVAGLLSSLAMAFGSGGIARFIAGSQADGIAAQPSMLAAAPSLLLVSVITAYRGYFQGLQDMTPTAVSQVCEQIVKIIPGFYIAYQMNRFGVEYGAAGAMWGVALSEAVALAYLMIAYARRKRRQGVFPEADGPGGLETISEPFGLVAGRLVSLALPMMAGALFLPLSSLADAFIVMNRLHDLGYDGSAIKALYGVLSGVVNVLVNVPSVLSLSLSTSLIPAIAEANERRDYKAVLRRSRTGLRMTMLVSIPSAVGLAVLAWPVLNLLYGSSLTQAELSVGSGLLLSSAVSVVFLSIVQSTNGTLQGLGKVTVPMVSLAIGAVIKIALNYTLVGIPRINIHGAPLGTIVCYLIPAIINLFFVSKATGMKLNAAGMLIRPGLASAFMGGAAWSLQHYLAPLIGGRWSTAVAVLLAIPIYSIFAVLFGAIGREELIFLPKGEIMISFLDKFGLLKGNERGAERAKDNGRGPRPMGKGLPLRKSSRGDERRAYGFQDGKASRF